MSDMEIDETQTKALPPAKRLRVVPPDYMIRVQVGEPFNDDPVATFDARADIAMCQMLDLIKASVNIMTLTDDNISVNNCPFADIRSLVEILSTNTFADDDGTPIVAFELEGYITECHACGETFLLEEDCGYPNPCDEHVCHACRY